MIQAFPECFFKLASLLHWTPNLSVYNVWILGQSESQGGKADPELKWSTPAQWFLALLLQAPWDMHASFLCCLVIMCLAFNEKYLKTCLQPCHYRGTSTSGTLSQTTQSPLLIITLSPFKTHLIAVSSCWAAGGALTFPASWTWEQVLAKVRLRWGWSQNSDQRNIGAFAMTCSPKKFMKCTKIAIRMHK